MKMVVVFFLAISVMGFVWATPCSRTSCLTAPCCSWEIDPRANVGVVVSTGQSTQKGVVCVIENDTWDTIWVVRKNKWPQKVIGGKIFSTEIPVTLTDRDPDRIYPESRVNVPTLYPVLDGYCEKYSDQGRLKFTKVRNITILATPEEKKNIKKDIL